MRDLRPGDRIQCQGIVCTIKEIAWQEPWALETASDMGFGGQYERNRYKLECTRE